MTTSRIQDKCVRNKACGDPLAPRPVGAGKFTQIPNLVLEQALCRLNEIDGRVFLWIFRQTAGWNRDAVRISAPELAAEFGIKRSRAYQALAELKRRHLIVCTRTDGYVTYGVGDLATISPKPMQSATDETSRDPSMLADDSVHAGGKTGEEDSALVEKESTLMEFSAPLPLMALNTGLNTPTADGKNPAPAEKPEADRQGCVSTRKFIEGERGKNGPEPFETFIQIFIWTGVPLSPRDIAEAKGKWSKVASSEHEPIFANLHRLINSGYWSDATHMPTPANYLFREYWKRRAGPRLIKTLTPEERERQETMALFDKQQARAAGGGGR